MRSLVHGLPGSGKSEVIHLMRQMFVEVFGWEHGREFVCLAQMNTMASLIGGFTVHSFGEIGIASDSRQKKSTQNRTKPDINTLFVKAKNLRWIIVDEISMISGELAGDLNTNLRHAIRKEHTHSLRGHRSQNSADPAPPYDEDTEEDDEAGGDKTPSAADSSLPVDGRNLATCAKSRRGCGAIDPQGLLRRSQRPFGGVNLIMLGDFWQLPPVNSTSLTANPWRPNLDSKVRQMLSMFWNRNNPDTLNAFFELKEQHRTTDEWLLRFLTECRHGRQSEEMYNFVHGHPTSGTGTWMPSAADHTKGVPRFVFSQLNTSTYHLQLVSNTHARGNRNRSVDQHSKIPLNRQIGRVGSGCREPSPPPPP
jgi:hypothetical protein